MPVAKVCGGDSRDAAARVPHHGPGTSLRLGAAREPQSAYGSRTSRESGAVTAAASTSGQSGWGAGLKPAQEPASSTPAMAS